ncbi:hypothetical protein [Natrinema sp. HArc-T2]|uniref:hypothetical protein n=1 Tax=Natrinema sp. HArc-T2 TaxID=3242701 RepID=UPI00359EB32B
MWPLELYTRVGQPASDSTGTLSVADGALAAYRSLEPFVRVGIQFVVAVLVTMIVLGLLHSHGSKAVRKSRQSPVISVGIGFPSLLVVSALAGTGYLIVDTSVGVFFGIPLVILGATVIPVVLAIGLTAIGCTIASRLGSDRLWVGIVVGALVSGLAGLALPATVAIAGLAGALGLGAGVRVLFGGAGTARPDERTVPPANKI